MELQLFQRLWLQRYDQHREHNMTEKPLPYKLRQIIYTVFFLMMTVLILTNSQKSLYFALNGLNLWFSKMIPTLLPFMILSGIMVRLRLTENFVSLLHPILHPIFQVRKNVTYAMIMGFLCGFPMGARVTGDLLDRKLITKREAEYLLAFCNNIGPVYFTGFVLPLLRRELLAPYLVGMYGLPFVYGLILRYTLFRDMEEDSDQQVESHQKPRTALTLLSQIDDAITSSVQNILMLGGYMILFNLFQLIPEVFSGLLISCVSPSAAICVKKVSLMLAPILEITGGLGLLQDSMPLWALLVLPFGGLSCIAQTYSTVRHSGLDINNYIKHKLILSGMTVIYYAIWQCFFPYSFLL